IARSPSTPPEALVRLFEGKQLSSPRVLADAVKNPNLPASLEESLLSTEEPMRFAAAQNPGLPAALRRKLAADLTREHRLVLARRFDLPRSLLEALAKDTQAEVAALAESTLRLLE